MALSHKLVELATAGVTDPQELPEVSVRGFPRLQRLGAARWDRDVAFQLGGGVGVMLFDLVRKGERQRCQVNPQVLRKAPAHLLPRRFTAAMRLYDPRMIDQAP